MARYEIRVTRGKTRTTWGYRWTKAKAKRIVKQLKGKSHVKNPRIRKA